MSHRSTGLGSFCDLCLRHLSRTGTTSKDTYMARPDEYMEVTNRHLPMISGSRNFCNVFCVYEN